MKSVIGTKTRDAILVIGGAVVILGFIYLMILGLYALR